MTSRRAAARQRPNVGGAGNGFLLASAQALCYPSHMSIKDLRGINGATPFHPYTVRTFDPRPGRSSKSPR